MLEIVGKILKMVLFCFYGVIFVLSAAAFNWLWPKREKIQSKFWRSLYIGALSPLMGIAYTAGYFEDWFGEIMKF